MARFSLALSLVVSAFAIVACGADPVDDDVITASVPEFPDTGSGQGAKPKETPTIVLMWYDELHGEVLYREAKRKEADLKDGPHDPEFSAAQDRLRVNLMKAYGVLAFGTAVREPEMPAAEIDFYRLWDAALAETDAHRDELWDVVEMFAGRAGFRGSEWAIVQTASWRKAGFDVTKPYGGAKHFDAKSQCFTMRGVDGEHDLGGRGAVSTSAVQIRRTLAIGDPLRTQWTRRLAEMSSVYECMDEGVPRMDPIVAYEAYVELGENAKAKEMAAVAASYTIESFRSYSGPMEWDESGGGRSTWIEWDPEVFVEVVGWYEKAGFDKPATCAALAKEGIPADIEAAKAWSRALMVYEFCGDTTNVTRMKVLITP